MLAMVVVLPQTPLLVPELATGAAAETADLRDACRAAAARMGAVTSEWVAVGADPGGRRTVPAGTRGSFVGFGADVVVRLAPDAESLDAASHAFGNPDAASHTSGNSDAENADARNRHAGTPDGGTAGGGTWHAGNSCAAGPAAGSGVAGSVAAGSGAAAAVAAGSAAGPVDAELPLPLLVAGWVAAGTGARIRGELVAPDTSREKCAALGAELGEERVGLLVVGDGSAKHTLKAPGHLDERSGPFDDAVARALREADPAGLAALDPELARELWAVGRAPWQVLAGAAAGRRWTGELLYTGAPYGVGYHVAVWTPCPD